jgi:glycosyltransferase involved in cell wall biosynthesis
MVYLEAQAQGCPVLAEDRVGVRDVVGPGGWLAPANDPAAYAARLDTLIADHGTRRLLGRNGHAEIARHHLLGSARATLSSSLRPLIREPRR